MNQHLVALYELKRQTFLIGYIQSPQHFDAALAYAYYNRVAPIFHEHIARETFEGDPFEDVYAVKASFVDEITRYVDSHDRTGDLAKIAFNRLEDKFGGYKVNRMELVYVLEYARIDGRFTEKLGRPSRLMRPLRRVPWPENFPRAKCSFLDSWERNSFTSGRLSPAWGYRLGGIPTGQSGCWD